MAIKVFLIASLDVYASVHRQIDSFLSENHDNLIALVNASQYHQNINSDYYYAYHHYNGSFFYALSQLASEFEKKYPGRVVYLPAVLGDLSGKEVNLGQTYQQSIENENYFPLITHQDIHIEDPTQLVLLCWHINRIAEMIDGAIDFELHHHSHHQLFELKNSFNKNTNLIPKECYFSLFEYQDSDIYPNWKSTLEGLMTLENQLKSQLDNLSVEESVLEQILQANKQLLPSQKELHRHVFIEQGFTHYACFIAEHIRYIRRQLGHASSHSVMHV